MESSPNLLNQSTSIPCNLWELLVLPTSSKLVSYRLEDPSRGSSIHLLLPPRFLLLRAS